ncbi:alcohol dehydrogenase catalytic domain-containing protein [Comamonas sp. JC664]|uniref:alcohol dehydrogenase catalytic domain-containing protein n=1 Tax=Comamonas sp. JC664 TaxID=2801917 RepID=UPI00174A21D4|nr:alcohol dehydrogenase catalytic domain-containing protein [Comamonas sp. JC664]
MKPGPFLGHDGVGVIEELASDASGFQTGDRGLLGAITPWRRCNACLSAPYPRANLERLAGRREAGRPEA